MAAAMMQPAALAEQAAARLAPAAVQRMWPLEAATKPFIDFLKAQYDHTQLTAIEAAACHLGARPDAAESGAGLPFVLIQVRSKS